MDFPNKDRYGIFDLVEIVKILRSPKGCPWDRKQTHKSIRRNFIEETYEAVEAIDNEDSMLLKEELGDVLLQIVMHAEMESELSKFTFDDVCNDICEKLVYRHPHVFGDSSAETSSQALEKWEDMKRKEKGQETATDTLTQVSKALPALIYSEKVQKRAAKVGFDYNNAQDAIKHLESEIRELKEAVEKQSFAEIYEEFGDVLFSCVNVSRFLSVDAEQALTDSTKKFIGRFTAMEQMATKRGINLEDSTLDLLDSLWEEAKNT